MTEPGAGRFFHHGWEVAAESDPLRARVVSCHEFGHAALNSSTAWGGLIQQLALAERFVAGELVALPAAVAAARQVHEAYATQVSVSALAPQAGAVERLLTDQAGYARFSSIARRVGPAGDAAAGWEDADGLGSARMAALAVCMQSPAVERLLERGTERFRLADVTSRDWPDRRLRTLTALAPRLWGGLRPPADPGERFGYALDVTAEALRAAGHPTLSRAQYRALLPDLTADLDRLAGTGGTPVELDVAGETGVPGLFAAEAVRARARLPTAVSPRMATDTGTGIVTRRAAVPHVFLTVRRMKALRAQYDLRPDPALPAEAPVTAVLTPYAVDGRVDQLRLTPLHEPADLDLLDRSHLVVTGLSLDCLRDRPWSARWLPALRARSRVVGLLDVPPEMTISAWLRTGAPLGMQLVTTTVAGHVETALVFRVAEEEPVVLPVTPASRTALVMHVERVSRGTATLTDDLLDDTDEALVRLVLDHVLTEDAVRPLIVEASGT